MFCLMYAIFGMNMRQKQWKQTNQEKTNNLSIHALLNLTTSKTNQNYGEQVVKFFPIFRLNNLRNWLSFYVFRLSPTTLVSNFQFNFQKTINFIGFSLSHSHHPSLAIDFEKSRSISPFETNVRLFCTTIKVVVFCRFLKVFVCVCAYLIWCLKMNDR